MQTSTTSDVEESDRGETRSATFHKLVLAKEPKGGVDGILGP